MDLCGLGVQNRWKSGRLQRQVKSTSACPKAETDLLRDQYQHLVDIFTLNYRKNSRVAGFATWSFQWIIQISVNLDLFWKKNNSRTCFHSVLVFKAEKDWKTEKLKSEKWKASYIKSPYKNNNKHKRSVFIITFLH